MIQNYFRKIIIILLFLLSPMIFAQQILVQQAKISTGWVKTVASGENISFPAAAASPSSFDFVIKNTGVANLTISGVQITGANAANFVAGPVGSLTVLPSQSTSFTVTYTATAATMATAQITILNNSPSPAFSFVLKGAPFNLYGPASTPFGTITPDSNGNIGHAGGKNILLTNISMGTQTTTYWGPHLNASGNFGIKLSLDNGTYINEENLTFAPAESNLLIGKAVWRGSTFIQNAISFTTVPVQIRATLLTKKPDNSVYPMINPATLGLSEQIGALVQFSALSDFLVANYLIEASTNGGVSWTPYLTFYDNYPTPPGPLPGQGIGNAYSTVSNGFYWLNFAPKITQNQILQANEGGSATITTAFLNGSDNEDMPGNPAAMVFTFQSSNPGTNPLVFGTGVLKKNGVVMVETDTFTLSDIQNGLITYEHSGSETVYDEFQFSLVDSKGKLAQDGPNSVFSFKINITAADDVPVTANVGFAGSYAVPLTANLTATDADSTTLTYEIVSSPTSGTITSFNAATGAFTYTSSTNLPGTDTFTFRVSDGTSLSNVSTATITLINLPPAGTDTGFTVLEDVQLTSYLSAIDPEGSLLTYQILSPPAHGTLTIQAFNGNIAYTPNNAYFGLDTFTYTATDAQGNVSAPITVNIIVRPRLDPGDVIAVDENMLHLYDPATGQNVVLTQAQGMTESINTAYKKNVGLFVMDKNTGLISVDAFTGVQSLVLGASNFSMAGPIGAPPGILIDNQGQIVISQSTGIIKVDPLTAVITPLFSGGLLTYPTGMVYLASGDMIVSDAGLITGGTSRILRITPAGVQSVVSTGGNILLPLDLGLIDQNTIVVADGASFAGGTDKIYKIDLTTGTQTILATGGNIAIPSGIDVFQDTAYVVNKEGTSLVIGVDTTTGTQTVLNGPSLNNPWGLIVIPESIVFDNTTVTNVSCMGATDGQAVITFSGGVGPYDYALDSTTVTNVTSPITISNLAAGTYNIVVTDSEGATAATSIIISTLPDTTVPTITAPIAVTVPADSGSCVATNVAIGTPSFLDNCPGVTVASDAPATFVIGITTVTWTATDAAGNTANATQTITVEDTQNPTITAPVAVTVAADMGSCNAAALALGTPTFSDNCTGATVANDAPATFPLGVTTVTWTATDAAGNTATATQTVTVQDSQNPTITAPVAITVPADLAACTASAVVLGTPIFSDNCTVATVANDAPATFPIGLTTVTWTATDAAGNTATATQTVTVEDTQNPVITAPIAIIVPADLASCMATAVVLGTPIFSDNCTGAIVANDAPVTFPVGTTTVTWTASDAAGNTATATQTVTVEDNENPVITAPSTVTVPADIAGCDATGVLLGTPTFSDNCTGTTVANDAPATFPIGTTTVTWTATDAAGNTATATQTVTVQDDQNPVITAPVAIAVPADSGSCDATSVVLGTPTFSDNCAGATVTNDAQIIFPVGITTVTWTATDAAGNTATATQTVTVEDNQNPIITAPAAITIAADLAACEASAVVLGIPVFSDNCTGAIVANDAPATFPIGVTTVTWTATDVAGNSAIAIQTVTVEDTENPAITAPGAITLPADAGICEAATVVLGTPVFSDNCTGATVANDAPVTFPVGTTTVTWTATDTAGNTATATQTVTIEDNENPIIVAPVAITVPADSGSCEAASVVLGTPIFADNCTGATVANDAPATFPIGITTVTWTATDAAGNSTTATQTVTVEDNQNPVITIPAPMSVSTDATSCEATGVVLATPVFSDNCTGATIANDAPAAFPLGVTIVTWTVTDAAGNTNTTTQQITVEDNQNPIVTAPAAITVPTDAAACEATGVVLGTPVFSDNCVGVTITNNAPATFPQGITNVTWTATDAAGNIATAIQTVTVQDVQNPLIAAPSAITVPATAGACYAANVNLGNAVASDNCTNYIISNNAPVQFPIGITTVTWTVTDVAGNTATATQTVTVNDTQNPSITVPANVITSTDADSCVATGVILGLPTVIDNCTNFNVTNNAPTTYPLGATIVTWTITDQAGNSDTGYQVVSVMDTHAPLVTNLNPITVPANPNSCEATNVNLGSPVFTDNCMLDTVTNNAPVIFPGGVTTVTWTATDEEGNIATFTQTVTVVDTQNPIITAPAAITTAGNQNCQYVGLDLGEPVVSDNCPDYVVTNNAPAAFPLGQTTVIWTVTDISGNIATTTQLVTITMPAAPITNAEQQFCFGATIASLTAETDNVVWYDAETDGTLVTAETVLTNDTTYYAATLIEGCESLTRTPVHVTIITTPTPSGNTLQEFCNEAFVADFVTTSENVVWYAAEDGTTPLEATVQLVDGVTYYGSIIDPITGCESPVRLAVTVMIHVGPEATGRTEYQFCSENFPTLAQLSVNYAAGNWYADAEGEQLLDATTVLTDETIYFFRMFDSVTGCESPVGLEVLVDLIGCDVDSYNFLTPDNNDKNEFLAFKDLEYYPDNMLQIFDRQGKMVFQTIKYGQNNNYFTGEVDNKALPTGTYYYVLEYFSPVTERQEVKKGFLYINNNE